MSTYPEHYKRIKLKTSAYEIVYVCEHYHVYRVIDGKRNAKTDLTNKHIEAVYRYLADAEMMKQEEIRRRYEEAESMDPQTV